MLKFIWVTFQSFVVDLEISHDAMFLLKRKRFLQGSGQREPKSNDEWWAIILV